MSRRAEQRLRRAGYRVTKQRMAIYEHLLSVDTHPTVDDIYQMVQEEFPRISLATVYNAVDSLVDVGLVRRIHRGTSSARYDAAMEDHAHFRCLMCDRIWDVAMPSMPVATEELATSDVVGVNVEFFGYCASCRRRKLGLPPLDARESS